MNTRTFSRILLVILALTAALAAQPAQTTQMGRRPLKLDDLPRLREIRDPQLSPDGQWVAYVLAAIDVKEDKSVSQIWMTSYDGKNTRQMTTGEESASAPRFTPDGKFLSFTSSRKGTAKGSQVWLLDRDGGEARQLTSVKGRLQGYEWSPDSRRLALVIGDPDPEAEAQEAAKESGGKPKAPKPIVIDRYKFKQDGQGYLLSGRHSYVYLFDIASGKLERLTQGHWDEAAPAWSPDGSRIAFISNHAADPDRDPDGQLFVAAAQTGATEKPLTTAANRVGRSRPEWSPDGRWLTYLESEERKWGAYSMTHLALAPSDGSAAPRRIPAVEALDRGVSSPSFSPDGKYIRFTVTDDRSVYPAQVDLNGKLDKLMAPPVFLSAWDEAGGRT
ncbi:MAG: TolB family protein, partial [Blastocatellia bacterium]